MISLQARIAKLLCRVFVKRAFAKPSKTPMEGIRRLRTRLGLYDPVNSRFTRDFEVEILTGPVAGEWIRPPGAPTDRVLLYLHGGGYVACSPLTHRRLTTALALESGYAVFAARYRLAPESPFPAALEDALAAYDMLRARGTPASGIAIAGDSAGGGLACATVLALGARERPERVAGLLAYSPWTDLLATGETLVTNAKSDDMLVGSGVVAAARNYAPTDADLRDPLASPLLGDLRGLPETLIFASTSEVLLDDARRFFLKARAEGAAAELVTAPSMPHVWQVFYDFVPEARKSVEQSAVFLRRVLGGDPVTIR